MKAPRSLGKRLQLLRKEKGMKQKDVAEILNMTNRNYQRFEYGDIDVTASRLWFLADYYGVSVDFLLGRSDQR